MLIYEQLAMLVQTLDTMIPVGMMDYNHLLNKIYKTEVLF